MPQPTSRTPWRSGHIKFTPGTGVSVAVAYVAWEASRMTNISSLGLFVCFAVIATVLLDLVVAVTATRRAGLAASVTPTDGVVGDEAVLRVSVTGTRCPLRVKVGPSVVMRSAPPETGSMTLAAGSRGVISLLGVEVVSLGWCGLAGFLRRAVVELPQPFAVGPRPVRTPQGFPELSRSSGHEMTLPSTAGEMVRGVRDYVPGDRLRQVHWRATARLGTLVVKEVEDTFTPAIVVVLHLTQSTEGAEQAAGRAAWHVEEARRRGWGVLLVTRDVTGTVTGSVGSASDLNWRLARAVVGPVELPSHMRPGRPVLVVSDAGDKWH